MNVLLLLLAGTVALGQVEIPKGWEAEYGVTPGTIRPGWSTLDDFAFSGKAKILDLQVTKGAKAPVAGAEWDWEKLRNDPAAFRDLPVKMRFAQGKLALDFWAEGSEEAATSVWVSHYQRESKLKADTTVGEWDVKLDAAVGVNLAIPRIWDPSLMDWVDNETNGQVKYVVLGQIVATHGNEQEGMVRVTLAFGVATPAEHAPKPGDWRLPPEDVEIPPSVLVDGRVRFAFVSGQVEIRHHGEPDAWRTAGRKTVIYVDDHIRTVDDSVAVLNFSDMTTYVMGPNSEVIIDTPPEKDSKLSLVFGKIWSNIKKMMKDGTIDVQMSQGVAGIKGTVFACEESGKESTTKVFEGEVSVTARANGEVRQVKAGQMVRVTSKGFDATESFEIKQEQNEWAKYDPTLGKGPYAKPTPEETPASPGFAGVWDSNFGRVTLRVSGNRVTGDYPHDSGRIDTILSDDGRTLTGTWSEAPTYQPPKDAGRMELTLSPNGQGFTGKWGYGDDSNYDRWTATRVVDASTEPLRPGREEAQQPRLGFSGTLVDLDPRIGLPTLEELPSRGMRVDQVTVGTPAALMELERGDIVISIDSMRFTSQAGYLHALRCAGQRPSLIIHDVRTKRFIRRSVDLPHVELPLDEAVPHPPETYLMAIDLESDFRP